MKRVLAFAISSVLIAALSLLVLRAASRQVPSNAWEPTGDLARARTGAASALLYDGRIIITGGNDGGVSLDSVEVYDPDTGVFTLSNVSLRAPRTGHAAALLYDGTLFIGGGFNGTDVLSSVDLYDPFDDILAEGPSL